MYDRILLPVDGSDAAKRAANCGFELARRYDATVEALYVVERRTLRFLGSERRTDVRERGEAVLAEIEALADDMGQSITTHVTEGVPSKQIGTYATDHDADLVVMGRSGRGGLGDRLLGGVTQQVLHHCRVPVLVVPDTDSAAESCADCDRVLVPTDGSENAEVATEHGASLADHYDAAVSVLSAVDLQAAGGLFNAGGLEKEFVERLENRGREAVDSVADEIRATTPDADVETAVVRGRPHQVIGEYVADEGVDLVVMGSHGRSNVGRQLLGSVTSQVLQTAKVPVLVVKRSESE